MCRLVSLLGLIFSATAVSADVQHNKWCQITTPDFELVSDVRQEDGRALARILTSFKLAVEALTGERLEGPPLTIIAFRRARDSRRVFANRNIDGGGILLKKRSTLAFVYNDTYPARLRARAAFSEYARYLLRIRQSLDYPAWYDEGYARLLSTMYSSKKGVVVGHVPPIVRPSMARLEPTLAELLEARRPFRGYQHRQGIYAKAWLLVHMLRLGHLAGLPAFHVRVPEMLAMIDAGEPAEVAMERGLGVDMATLQHQLEEYGKRKSLPTLTVDVDIGHETPMDSRCLDRMEVLRMLADAAATTRNHDYAAKLYEDMLAEKPDDVDALVELSYSSDDLGRALELACRALAVDPDHPRPLIARRSLRRTTDGLPRPFLTSCCSIPRFIKDGRSQTGRNKPILVAFFCSNLRAKRSRGV